MVGKFVFILIGLMVAGPIVFLNMTNTSCTNVREIESELTAEQVVEKYWELVSSGKVQEAHELRTSKIQGINVRVNRTSEYESEEVDHRSKVRFKEIKDVFEIAENKKTITAVLINKEGYKIIRYHKLIREDGKWKIQFILI